MENPLKLIEDQEQEATFRSCEYFVRTESVKQKVCTSCKRLDKEPFKVGKRRHQVYTC